jgi:hypothetical protein
MTLDDVFKKLEITLRKRDYDTRNLDRKVFDVNEAPHIYADRIEHVDDIVTALLREEGLRLVHGSVAQYQKEFVLEPYTLVVYKKGLYLAGYSHHHKSVRTFSLDGFREIERLKKDHFEYPKDYQPSQLVEGSFGLFGGPRTQVRLLFEAKVGRSGLPASPCPSEMVHCQTFGFCRENCGGSSRTTDLSPR